MLERIQELGIDTLVVAAFGQLLRRPLLEALTCVNIHASLLPQYRGAAPIERALMAGENVTGVSIMRITEGLDEGPWAERVEVSVGLRQDAGSLSRVLAVTGAVALVGGARLHRGRHRGVDRAGGRSLVRAQACACRTSGWTYKVGLRRAHDQVRALCPAVGCARCPGRC